jgi:hypothetical protein
MASWRTLSAEGEPFECDHGVALHRNEALYVVDKRQARVHAYRPGGQLEFSFGRYGSEPGAFRQPWGIASTGKHLVVSEYMGKRVQVFTPKGEPICCVVPRGGGCFAGVSVCPEEEIGSPGFKVLLADWDNHCVRVLRLGPWCAPEGQKEGMLACSATQAGGNSGPGTDGNIVGGMDGDGIEGDTTATEVSFRATDEETQVHEDAPISLRAAEEQANPDSARPSSRDEPELDCDEADKTDAARGSSRSVLLKIILSAFQRRTAGKGEAK